MFFIILAAVFGPMAGLMLAGAVMIQIDAWRERNARHTLKRILTTNRLIHQV